MDLANLKIDAHIRSPWEAIDLGAAMTRQWWWLAFLSWALPALIVFTVSSVIFYSSDTVPVLVTWWFKPLFDRGPLYIASQRLFDQTPSLRQVIWALPKLYRTDLLASLTWRRLSLTRSFDLPVTVLEGLKGAARSSRQSTLHRRYSNAATWLTLVMVHVELILVLGVFALASMMLPAFVELDFVTWWLAEDQMLGKIYNITYFASIALVGPFYSIAGFALYISRRIELEAWDIEVRFRHLAARAKRRGGQLGSILVPLLLIGMLEGVPAVKASEQSAPDAELIEAKTLIIDVKQDEVFHLMETVESWRLKDSQSEDIDSIPQWLIDFLDFLAPLFDRSDSANDAGYDIVPVLEIFAWILVALLIIWLLRRYRQAIGALVKPPRARIKEPAVPKAMFGLDISRETLPDNIPNAVEQLWLRSEHRAAISLLYRGLLSNLVHNYNFTFSSSDTEGECVLIVRQRCNDELSRYVERITRCWQSIAYGHRTPDQHTIQSLCDDWPKVFANA